VFLKKQITHMCFVTQLTNQTPGRENENLSKDKILISSSWGGQQQVYQNSFISEKLDW